MVKRFDGLRVRCQKHLRILVVVIALLAGFSSFGGNADQSDTWFRSLYEEGPAVPLVLVYVYYATHNLSGSCWFRYMDGREPVILHGKKQADGGFRPIVTYEAATESKAKWEKIPRELKQASSNTIKISRDNLLVRLVMDMKPFQKVIGVYRYGRIILENGDTAVFELKDLLPPAEESKGLRK